MYLPWHGLRYCPEICPAWLSKFTWDVSLKWYSESNRRVSSRTLTSGKDYETCCCFDFPCAFDLGYFFLHRMNMSVYCAGSTGHGRSVSNICCVYLAFHSWIRALSFLLFSFSFSHRWSVKVKGKIQVVAV